MQFEFTNVNGQKKTISADKLVPPDNYMKLFDANGEVKFLVNPNAVAFVEAIPDGVKKIEVVKP